MTGDEKTASRRACRFFVAWSECSRRCHHQRWRMLPETTHDTVIPSFHDAARHAFPLRPVRCPMHLTHPLFNVDSADQRTAGVKKRQTLRSAVFMSVAHQATCARCSMASLRTSDARRRCRPVGLRRRRLLAGPANQLARSARTRRCCCYAVLRTMRTRWCASTGCRCRQR
jgi:hypothetical protein